MSVFKVMKDKVLLVSPVPTCRRADEGETVLPNHSIEQGFAQMEVIANNIYPDLVQYNIRALSSCFEFVL